MYVRNLDTVNKCDFCGKRLECSMDGGDIIRFEQFQYYKKLASRTKFLRWTLSHLKAAFVLTKHNSHNVDTIVCDPCFKSFASLR